MVRWFLLTIIIALVMMIRQESSVKFFTDSVIGFLFFLYLFSVVTAWFHAAGPHLGVLLPAFYGAHYCDSQ